MLRELRDRHKVKPFDRHTIFPFIEFYWDVCCGSSPLSLIVFLVDPEGLYGLSVGRTINKVQTSTHGEVRYAGTGALDLLGQLRDGSDQFESLCGDPPGAPQLETINIALSLIGRALKHELHHMDSLRLLYGGGYEVIAHWDNSFKKLPELTQVMWYTDRRDGWIFLKNIYFVVKHQYVGDLLVIRSLGFDKTGSGVPVFSRITPVPPVLWADESSPTMTCDHVPPIHSSMYAHFILIRHENDTASIAIRIDNQTPEAFQLEESDQGIVFHKTSAFVSEIEGIINRAIC